MANFFKDYQSQIKADKERKRLEMLEQTEKQAEYEKGDIVYINPMYDENRNGKRYFVDYLSDNHILLAKTKKEALSGYGYIYSMYDVR